MIQECGSTKNKSKLCAYLKKTVVDKFLMIQLTGVNKWSDIADNNNLCPFISPLRKRCEQAVVDINAKHTYSNLFAKIKSSQIFLSNINIHKYFYQT